MHKFPLTETRLPPPNFNADVIQGVGVTLTPQANETDYTLNIVFGTRCTETANYLDSSSRPDMFITLLFVFSLNIW